ncbi:uroporphyrinogen-III synthase [Rhodocaloribacter sp.]
MDKPLRGKRIVVTRAREQARPFAARLEAEDATPVLFPTLRFAPMPDPAPLDDAVTRLAAYDLLLFTSANGVRFFTARVAALGVRVPRELRIAAVGPATAAALERHGLRADFVPGVFVAEKLAEGLRDVAGKTILLPQAEIARKTLARALAAAGARVDALPVYRTLPARPTPSERAALDAGADVLTFASPSSVRGFVALLGDRARLLARTALVACLGPVTAAAADERGLRPGLVPEAHTTDGLVDALIEHFAHTTAVS